MRTLSARRSKALATQILAKLEAVHPPLAFVPRLEPLEELVSCILSQHSADVVSFPTFVRLRERFPEWNLMEDAPLEELVETIKAAGLGRQKALATQAALAAVRAEFGSYTLEPLRTLPVPASLAWLESLPGIGPKTASIVLCFAFGSHAVPVDTHVQRVASRLGLLAPKVSSKAAHDWLREVVPEGYAYRFHIALIEHGRAVCTARNPACDACSLDTACQKVGVDAKA